MSEEGTSAMEPNSNVASDNIGARARTVACPARARARGRVMRREMVVTTQQAVTRARQPARSPATLEMKGGGTRRRRRLERRERTNLARSRQSIVHTFVCMEELGRKVGSSSTARRGAARHAWWGLMA